MLKFKLIKEKLSSIESVVGEKIRNYVGRDLSNDEKIAISVLVNGLFESSSMMANLGRVDKPDPTPDRCQLDEAEEAGRELVIAGRHAA